MTSKKRTTGKTPSKTTKNSRKKPIKASQPSSFINAVHYEIVKEGDFDEYGTIRFLNEDRSDEERLTIIKKEAEDTFSYPPNQFIDLLNKLESNSNPKSLKLNNGEHEILKKALRLAFECETKIRPEHNTFSTKLAWANTAMQNKKKSYGSNLREAGVRLGFTNPNSYRTSPFPTGTKGKKKTFESLKVICKYHDLCNELNDRKKAIKELLKIFPFGSPDACSRYLRKYGQKNIPDFRKD